MADFNGCIHHWLLDEQGPGGAVQARCLKCGSRRQFPTIAGERLAPKAAGQRSDLRAAGARS